MGGGSGSSSSGSGSQTSQAGFGSPQTAWQNQSAYSQPNWAGSYGGYAQPQQQQNLGTQTPAGGGLNVAMNSPAGGYGSGNAPGVTSQGPIAWTGPGGSGMYATGNQGSLGQWYQGGNSLQALGGGFLPRTDPTVNQMWGYQGGGQPQQQLSSQPGSKGGGQFQQGGTNLPPGSPTGSIQQGPAYNPNQGSTGDGPDFQRYWAQQHNGGQGPGGQQIGGGSTGNPLNGSFPPLPTGSDGWMQQRGPQNWVPPSQWLTGGQDSSPVNATTGSAAPWYSPGATAYQQYMQDIPSTSQGGGQTWSDWAGNNGYDASSGEMKNANFGAGTTGVSTDVWNRMLQAQQQRQFGGGWKLPPNTGGGWNGGQVPPMFETGGGELGPPDLGTSPPVQPMPPIRPQPMPIKPGHLGAPDWLSNMRWHGGMTGGGHPTLPNGATAY